MHLQSGEGCPDIDIATYNSFTGDDTKEYFRATRYSIDPSTKPAGVSFPGTDNKPVYVPGSWISTDSC